MITPAISVTSAVEGLKVATPGLAHLVVPISLAILVALFAVQRHGTGAVGWLFGPVILVWFVVDRRPRRERGDCSTPACSRRLSPTWGARFMVDHGVAAFLTLGGVVLAVTGAEALYADRGHFGASPIRATWFAIVLPAVLLSYLGQGALILAPPGCDREPVLPAGPELGPVCRWCSSPRPPRSSPRRPRSPARSRVARQAVQLGFLPRLKIVHTSELEGQIYVPLINWVLAAGVVALVLIFQRSARARRHLRRRGHRHLHPRHDPVPGRRARAVADGDVEARARSAPLFLTVEVSFFSSNLTKISHGAWLPLCVGLIVAAIVMVTWRKGREIVTRNRDRRGGLARRLPRSAARRPSRRSSRAAASAIFLNPGKETTPLALRADVEHHRAFHEKVLIVSVDPVSVPHVDGADRFVVERLGSGLFKVLHVTIRIGYHDSANVPAALALARKRGLLERNLDLEHASYFVSRITITPTTRRRDAPLAQAAVHRDGAQRRQPDRRTSACRSTRTVIVGSQVAL